MTRELHIVFRGGNPYADLDFSRLLEILARTRLRRQPGTERIATGRIRTNTGVSASDQGWADAV
jgi:hypothetical protein